MKFWEPNRRLTIITNIIWVSLSHKIPCLLSVNKCHLFRVKLKIAVKISSDPFWRINCTRRLNNLAFRRRDVRVKAFGGQVSSKFQRVGKPLVRFSRSFPWEFYQRLGKLLVRFRWGVLQGSLTVDLLIILKGTAKTLERNSETPILGRHIKIHQLSHPLAPPSFLLKRWLVVSLIPSCLTLVLKWNCLGVNLLAQR